MLRMGLSKSKMLHSDMNDINETLRTRKNPAPKVESNHCDANHLQV